MEDRARATDPEVPVLQRIARYHYTARQLVALDALAVVALSTLAVVAGPHKVARVSGTGWLTINVVATTAAAVGLLIRRHATNLALVVAATVAMTGLLLRADGPALFYLVPVLYSKVSASTRRVGLTVLGVLLVVDVACSVLGGGRLVASTVNATVAVLVLGWLAGEHARASRAYGRAKAEQESERAAYEVARKADDIREAITGERAKIARDLHDIVAHAMSVIAVRSGVARMVIDTQPDQAREALSIIEITTRRALQEMRLLVNMLRDADEAGIDLVPLPGVADLDRLIEEIHSAGVTVAVDVTGAARDLPPAADLSAYRIIQEALTNVVRHVGPTTAQVHLAYSPGAISINVTDRGPQSGTAPAHALDRHGTGHGIIGMRERAALFGGTLLAERRGAGFVVAARLRTDD